MQQHEQLDATYAGRLVQKELATQADDQVHNPTRSSWVWIVIGRAVLFVSGVPVNSMRRACRMLCQRASRALLRCCIQFGPWTVKWPTDAIQNPWRNKLWLSWIGSFPWVFQALFFSFNGAWCVSTFNFTNCPVHAVTGDSVFGSCGAVLKIVNVDTEPAWREWNLGSYTVRSRNQKSSLSAEASYHPKKP